MSPTSITLYRPVGQKELDLIAASGYGAFPPRLPDQPIFYPVLTLEYAEQIARDWNTKDERSGFVGYVLELDLEASYIAKFETHRVSSSKHLEYCIPANELEEFNSHIVGKICVIKKFEATTQPED